MQISQKFTLLRYTSKVPMKKQRLFPTTFKPSLKL